MDLADIRRKALAAREFVVQEAGSSYTLRLPTAHDIEVEVIRSRLHDGEVDPAQLTVIRRRLLERALVAWSGVACERLAAGAGAEPADVSTEAAAFLLDAEPDLAQRLDAEFVERLAARRQTQGTAEKN